MLPLETFFLISGYIQNGLKSNIRETRALEVACLWGLLNASFFICYLGATLLFKNKYKARIYTFLFAVAFFLFSLLLGHCSVCFKWFSQFSWGHYRYLIALYGIIFIIFAYLISTLLNPKKTVHFFTFLTGCFFVSSCIMIIPDYWAEWQMFNFKKPGYVKKNIGEKPNIYYIILDAYTRHDVLQEQFGYNNNNFIEFLKTKGFFIAEQSCSNYCHTEASLSSTFLMDYLSSDEVLKKNKRWPLTTGNFWENAEVIRLLKGHGYTFINIGSVWSPCNYISSADYGKRVQLFGFFSSHILSKTLFVPFAQYFKLFNRGHNILDQFKILEKIPSKYAGKGPLFVFCHIVCPHGPAAFNADGTIIEGNSDDSGIFIESQKESYINQVKAVNLHTKKCIEAILKNSQSPPVIIVQGDHGDFSDRSIFKSNKKLPVKERMSILNALYFPNGGRDKLYHSISSVNTFRVLFNYYLGEELSVLPDNCYFSYFHFLKNIDMHTIVKMPINEINTIEMGGQ